jgi:hypothetical protein
MNDGIRVRLLWRQDDARVVVAVDDANPYAYAAWHRIPTRAPAVLAGQA